MTIKPVDNKPTWAEGELPDDSDDIYTMLTPLGIALLVVLIVIAIF